MDAGNLVRMANRIGDFFESQPDRAAALADIADHLRKFWEPRMRREFLALLEGGAAGELKPIVREAVLAHRAELMPD
ncbi:formate dehydrogenase subunit delta [Xenophilus sp.]|uniref:formate dehydrogenase subunit delta n=1 Tax=Xenophilus sp. TaxID=1873499 RepID=UPI0037DC19EE